MNDHLFLELIIMIVMTNYMCGHCNIEFEVQGNDSVVICSKCGGINTIDKTFRSFSGYFGFFVIFCSLLVFWHAFDMSTWGNYQSLMAPQYMIFALILLLIGVGIIAWNKKHLNQKATKYYVDQQQLLERMQSQENSKNNSEETDEKVFRENEMSSMGENTSQTRNEPNIDSAIIKEKQMQLEQWEKNLKTREQELEKKKLKELARLEEKIRDHTSSD
ncbi:MAG: hypothetical protein HOD60_04070 [Candidatus Nitrosopelagicus sp.]|nr:hypothetical protein [Candidatus Nitrosopelagicus sp.]